MTDNVAGDRNVEAFANGSIILIHPYFKGFRDGAILYRVTKTRLASFGVRARKFARRKRLSATA
jgi:hypothetical protein